MTQDGVMRVPNLGIKGGLKGREKVEGPEGTFPYGRTPIVFFEREKVDFIETTALRQRRNGGREVTVTSRLMFMTVFVRD